MMARCAKTFVDLSKKEDLGTKHLQHHSVQNHLPWLVGP